MFAFPLPGQFVSSYDSSLFFSLVMCTYYSQQVLRSQYDFKIFNITAVITVRKLETTYAPTNPLNLKEESIS